MTVVETPGILPVLSRTLQGSGSSSAGRLWHEELLHIELDLPTTFGQSEIRGFCEIPGEAVPMGKSMAINSLLAAGFSITVVPTLERAFDLDTFSIWLFLSEDHELLTECWKVQFRHFLMELFRQEVDIFLVVLKPARSHRD